ncbi:hypothetical protein ACVWYH_001655 [Bradyrhizobium sp. GM24.11]|jgi:hypothetical protein
MSTPPGQASPRKSGLRRFTQGARPGVAGDRQTHQWPFTAETVGGPPYRATGRRASISSRHQRRGHAAAQQPRVLGHKRRGASSETEPDRLAKTLAMPATPDQDWSLPGPISRIPLDKPAKRNGKPKIANMRKGRGRASPRLSGRVGGPAKTRTQNSRVAGVGTHRPGDPARADGVSHPIRLAAPTCLQDAMVAG